MNTVEERVGSQAPPGYSPYDYRIHEDPYPTYARLREESPLYHNDEFGFWALSRHGDVLNAFRDIETFSNANGVSLDPSAYGPNAHRAMSFLAMDPPRHTRMRALVSRGFTPRRVAEMEPHIRELTLEHLLPALESGSFDLIADFAGKLPMDVISEMIGVPNSDRIEVRRLADLVVHREEAVHDVPTAGMEAALVLAGYYSDLISQRRRRPEEDLTSALMSVELDGDRLSDDDIVSFLFLLVVAGNETTTKLLGNAWYWAWKNPDQLAKVWADPLQIPKWIEETLRFDPSSQSILRTVARDVEFYGQTVPSGDKMLLLAGSANRDHRAFPDPDKYDIERDTSKLLSFGGGRHFCMGAALARMEAEIALGELVSRVASYEVDEPSARRVHSINVRGFAALPTSVTLA